MASQYTRGGMEIDGQQSTFSSVIKAGVSSSLVLAYSIVFLTFAFATGSGWFTAIGVALAVGIVGGVVMKQGPWYWLFTAFLTVFAGVIGLAISVFAG
ncbi:MAG: hypothetical protein HLUCCA04_13020 [Oceanicaulis sp. HLUCCA04]|nr:MAG: hypothetical protein HLUCCA04_13020 [Oceanicaulis sp. HLUCCA04]